MPREAHREGHDPSASRGHEGLGDFEYLTTAAAQLLPLGATKLVVEALCDVPRQLYVLPLILACPDSASEGTIPDSEQAV